MRFLVWVLRAFLFFTLFAFALNNEHEVTVNWFFGHHWQAPLVIVVLAVLTAGATLGVLAMVPSWWRHRAVARRHAPPPADPAPSAPGPTASPGPADEAPPADHPPRLGL